MKRATNNLCRSLFPAIAAVLLAAALPGGTSAQTGQRQQIGSVSARAPRSTVTLGQNETTIELSGGVSIQTDTGDLMRAQRIVMLVGPMPDPKNPGRTKTDVRKATATGDVSFKHAQRITTTKDDVTQVIQRVITGTATHGELDRVNQNVALLQGVRAQALDTQADGGQRIASYDLQNVAAAKMDLRTTEITADAPGGQKMRMTARQRVTPNGAPAYWRLINGTAHRSELKRVEKTKPKKAEYTAVLIGDVDITADEPTAIYTWRNAARATIDSETNKVQAEAPNGQQMNVDVRFKQKPQAASAEAKQ